MRKKGNQSQSKSQRQGISLGVLNPKYTEREAKKAVARCLTNFYNVVLGKLDAVKLNDVVKRKNPYLFRAKGVQNASELITGILSALVSSSEETIFGTEFVEPLAMSVGGAVKSVAEGVDAEIHDDANKKLFAIAIKSGPAVFNSSSKKRQITNLNRAGKIAQQQEVAYYPVIGYCYGKKSKKPSIVFELAGQDFWAALTGEDDFYLKIIEFMDKKPEEYVEKFKDSYGRAHNRLVQQFVTLFCRRDGAIDWNRLVQFVSGRD